MTSSCSRTSRTISASISVVSSVDHVNLEMEELAALEDSTPRFAATVASARSRSTERGPVTSSGSCCVVLYRDTRHQRTEIVIIHRTHTLRSTRFWGGGCWRVELALPEARGMRLGVGGSTSNTDADTTLLLIESEGNNQG